VRLDKLGNMCSFLCSTLLLQRERYPLRCYGRIHPIHTYYGLFIEVREGNNRQFWSQQTVKRDNVKDEDI
jgi:hypothetical protein